MQILYHHRVASKDGQFVHIEEIIKAFSDQGHNVDIVSPKMNDSSAFGHDGGIVSELKKYLPKSIYEMMELAYGFVIAYKLICSIIKNKPDVIYERYNLYQPVGVLVSKLFGIPLILEINAPLKQERERYSGGLGMPWLAKKIENFTWKNATATLPVTKVLSKHLLEAGVDGSNIHVIHNGIREKVLERMDAKPARQQGDGIVIGFVGFMHLTCGVDEAIELIAKTKNKKVRLICVGDGNILPELKNKVRELGVEDRVDFPGLVSREDVFSYIETFDIALQPAVTEYASPLKMFEYMAVKSLIIAPDSENILEILTPESAVLFDKDVDGDFYTKLTYSIENFDALKSRGEVARSLLTSRGFIWQENVKKIISLAKTISL
jgi:glycosyltransferase involved in cell wall biosynthesis